MHAAPPMVKTPPGGHFARNRLTKYSESLVKLFYLWMEIFENTSKTFQAMFMNAMQSFIKIDVLVSE